MRSDGGPSCNRAGGTAPSTSGRHRAIDEAEMGTALSQPERLLVGIGQMVRRKQILQHVPGVRNEHKGRGQAGGPGKPIEPLQIHLRLGESPGTATPATR